MSAVVESWVQTRKIIRIVKLLLPPWSVFPFQISPQLDSTTSHCSLPASWQKIAVWMRTRCVLSHTANVIGWLSLGSNRTHFEVNIEIALSLWTGYVQPGSDCSLSSWLSTRPCHDSYSIPAKGLRWGVITPLFLNMYCYECRKRVLSTHSAC